MAVSSKVFGLPSAVRSELDGRLRGSLFRDFDGHAAWLQSRGFPISGSALQRYAARNRAEIIKATPRGVVSGGAASPVVPTSMSPEDRRLECLRLAAAYGPANPDEHEAAAARLLRWVEGLSDLARPG